MNENLDLTKILEGCPEETKFYSSIFGEVTFVRITAYPVYPIELKVYTKTSKDGLITYVTKDGRKEHDYDGECTLFPSKDQRDWSKFERFWDKPKVERFDPKILQPFDKVLVRDNDCHWIADLFSHIDNSINGGICCSCFRWRQCIPYNEETKHLVGTKEDCPEFYKWWEE